MAYIVHARQVRFISLKKEIPPSETNHFKAVNFAAVEFCPTHSRCHRCRCCRHLSSGYLTLAFCMIEKASQEIPLANVSQVFQIKIFQRRKRDSVAKSWESRVSSFWVWKIDLVRNFSLLILFLLLILLKMDYCKALGLIKVQTPAKSKELRMSSFRGLRNFLSFKWFPHALIVLGYRLQPGTF